MSSDRSDVAIVAFRQGLGRLEPRTATSTATAANSGVFADLRPRTDDVAELGRRYTAERPRRPKLTLGGKWSQVQILSARLSPTQHSPRSKAIMVNRGIPRWVSIGVCTATGTAS